MALVIWGRKNSVNVQKVLWTCGELGLPYLRKEAGGAFGVVDTPEFRALNPNGRVPVLEDDDFVLWESNAIVRYLTTRYKPESGLYPEDPRSRADVDRWLDWQLSTLQPAERPVFWGMVRTPADKRDMAAIRTAAKAVSSLWQDVEEQLRDRSFITGEFTLADIVLGAFVHRWFGLA
jgi:glutathione S-transferase